MRVREIEVADMGAPSYETIIDEASRMVEVLRGLSDSFRSVSRLLIDTLQNGGKVLTAGNGGSAAEAMHMAEELSGRYHADRKALPGLALCADGTALTCIGNDYGFDRIFARQVEAFGKEGDVLVLFTTSGNSANLLAAAEVAKKRGIKVVALTGRGGGALATLADYNLDISGVGGAHVQEGHQILLHAFFEQIDAAFAEG